MEAFVIYWNPSDFPGVYVVRRWVGEVPDDLPWAVEPTLAAAQARIPTGAERMNRSRSDDSVIVELWLLL